MYPGIRRDRIGGRLEGWEYWGYLVVLLPLIKILKVQNDTGGAK
jgi:hypothetical protein